ETEDARHAHQRRCGGRSGHAQDEGDVRDEAVAGAEHSSARPPARDVAVPVHHADLARTVIVTHPAKAIRGPHAPAVTLSAPLSPLPSQRRGAPAIRPPSTRNSAPV